MLICDIVTEWWTLLQDGGWLNIWFSTSHHKQWRYDGILYLALNGNISHRLCSAIGALPRWRSSAASWPPQPPMFHFREKGFCWQKNPLSVIVMLIISYAKWAWQRQCSSRKDSCWREQPLRRLIVSEEAQRKWPPHWNPSVWPWGAGGSALQGGEHLREEVCQAETCGEVFPQNFPHLSLIRLRTFWQTRTCSCPRSLRTLGVRSCLPTTWRTSGWNGARPIPAGSSPLPPRGCWFTSS